jgi:predicted GNAT family N-acyltransferase
MYDQQLEREKKVKAKTLGNQLVCVCLRNQSQNHNNETFLNKQKKNAQQIEASWGFLTWTSCVYL